MADVPVPDPSGGLKPWLAAVFISAIVALAGVIVYLFRLNEKRARRQDAKLAEKDQVIAEKDKAAAVERADFNTRLEKLRADYEAKNRELAENHAADVKALYEDNRVHEDAARKEFADILENVSAKAGESSQAIVQMLDKFYDRFVGPRRY